MSLEMTCELWETKIDAYVDGELAPGEGRAFRDHLRSCAACSQAALGRMELKRAVHSAGMHHQPSTEFRARMARQIVAPAVVPIERGRWTRAWGLAAFAAVLALVAIAGAYLYVQHAHRQQALTEIADLHVSNLASANPVDVVSSDKHTVKPWFQGRLPFTFDLPELFHTQFELVGGRMVFVEHEPAALLVYGVRKHKISVIVSLDRAGLEKLGSTATSLNSFHLETWSHHGLRYIVISDASAQDVHGLAELLRGVSIAR